MKLLILTEIRYLRENYCDDILLKEAVEKIGGRADIKRWDDPALHPEDYDAAIVRSCWDYHNRKKEFLQALKDISEKTKLFNPYEIIEWNSDKAYLAQLPEELKSIDSYYIHSENDVAKVISRLPLEWEELVIKPSVSASGLDTYQVNRDQALEFVNKILEIGKTAMIQPFIESVRTEGERSLVVIAGECKIIVRKFPKAGGFLVHNHHEGRFELSEPTEKDKKKSDQIINALEKIHGIKPLYMRVDLLGDEDPLILELELIEPGLFIQHIQGGADFLVNAIAQNI